MKIIKWKAWYGKQGSDSEYGKNKGYEMSLMLDRCRNQENIHVESATKELSQTLSSATPGYTIDAVG